MLKIYIADDSLKIRDRLSELVASLDFGGLEIRAEAPQADILSIQEFQPDAAILDIHMPGGFDLLTSIKALRQPPTLIILTAFPYPQVRKKCLEAGADYFFDKTSEFEQIIEVLRALSPG
jgi:CheY-like chemotaxis protein